MTPCLNPHAPNHLLESRSRVFGDGDIFGIYATFLRTFVLKKEEEIIKNGRQSIVACEVPGAGKVYFLFFIKYFF